MSQDTIVHNPQSIFLVCLIRDLYKFHFIKDETGSFQLSSNGINIMIEFIHFEL